MMHVLAVAVGGAIGAMARYGAGLIATKSLGMSFPYGTLLVNLSGCFLMGLAVGAFSMKGPIDPTLKLFLTTGILGGFTTFSAFSLETVMLYERRPVLALAYVTVSVMGCIFMCLAGLRMIRP